MNKSIIALLFILAGAVLLYVGYERRQSLAGSAETLGKDIVSKIDGQARVPRHLWFFAGGGALVVIGSMIAARK